MALARSINAFSAARRAGHGHRAEVSGEQGAPAARLWRPMPWVGSSVGRDTETAVRGPGRQPASRANTALQRTGGTELLQSSVVQAPVGGGVAPAAERGR